MISASIFLITLICVSYSIRKIIYISHKKHLFDEPSEDRKIHSSKTPNLGGVAIFATMIFSSSLFISYAPLPHLNYISASVIILFFTGLTDDLVGLNPFKKFLAQLSVAILITVFAGLRFTSLHGIFGITEIPTAISIAISILFILLIINAFNLIDGINCLAGGIGLLVCSIFAFCFWQMHQTGFLFLSVAMCGCLTGFLFFNCTPAKIFMGDTGALFLGFMIAVFSIQFIELNKNGMAEGLTPFLKSAPALTFAMLIIPIFDTLRIFSLRIIKGKSPFFPDRNHIHHRLIDLGLSHLQSTSILLSVNIFCIALVIFFAELDSTFQFLIVGSFILMMNFVLSLIRSRKITKHIKVYSIPDSTPSLKFLLEKPAFLEKHEISETVKGI